MGHFFRTLDSTLQVFLQRYRLDDEDVDLEVEWAQESTGKRAAYGDFMTIDWIHDFAKERIRLKRLRTANGLKGQLYRLYDSSQAWIIVLLVGNTHT